MKKLVLLGVFTAFVITISAQDETVKELQKAAKKEIKKEEQDTTKAPRTKGGIFNLNVAQGALNNWAAGGDDFSITITSYLNLFSFYKSGRHSWDNILDLNFGFINTTSLGSRKNDDRLDILSKYGYGLTSKWNLAALVNFRSQMADGYTYPDDVRTFSSTFLSPAYLLTSIGLDFKPVPHFSFFISPITSRWVIVNDDTLSAKGLYGVHPGDHSNSEFGAFTSVNYIKDLTKSLKYRGRLELFSNYKNNPENIDLFMTNFFSLSLSKFLTANWNFDLIYDDDVKLFGKNGKSPALQMKSLVGIGLQAKF